MSVRRRAAKRDANEPEIITALRAVGAVVWQVSEKGVPDLVVGYEGATFLLEVKAPGKWLTPDQKDVHAAWKGGHIFVVETPAQALRAIGAGTHHGHVPWTDAERDEFIPPPRKGRKA